MNINSATVANPGAATSRLALELFVKTRHIINFNLFGANPTKWSNTLKHSLSVFDHFVGLALKG